MMIMKKENARKVTHCVLYVELELYNYFILDGGDGKSIKLN